MNGAASIGLLFWATFCVPSQSLTKVVLLILAAAFFISGSYHVWNKEHQIVLNLTGKTPIEAVDGLTAEFAKMMDWYASDAETEPKRLDGLIEETRLELRRHCPNYLHWFNDTVENPHQKVQIPTYPITGRKVEEMGKWASDQARKQSWELAYACHQKLSEIAIEIAATLP